MRRIPQLFGDTLALVGRRWRGFGEYALIGVAGYLVALVMLFLGLNALFDGQFFSKIEELTDPLGDSTVDFDAWLESFEVTPTPLAIGLLMAFGLASVVGFTLQDIATTRLALDDVQGREVNANRTLMATLRCLPKIFAFCVAIGLAIGLLGCGLCALLLWAAPVLGILWALAFIGAALVFGPLLAVYFVMVYVEPRLPSPRRWWHLMKGRKAAIWGRVFLISLAAELVWLALSMSLGALPIAPLFGDLIVNAIILPIVFMVVAVAHLLIYADLLSGEESAPAEVESPS